MKNIIRRNSIILAALIIFLATANSLQTLVSAHRFHTSLTRMDYNAEQKIVEITIQLFPHDLEDALSKKHNTPISLEKTPKVDEKILNYLAGRFILKNKAGEAKKLRYIGIEPETDSARLYLETSMPEGLDGATLENSVLQEIFADQVNLVTARFNDYKTDLVFKNNDAAQPLVKKAEQ